MMSQKNRGRRSEISLPLFVLRVAGSHVALDRPVHFDGEPFKERRPKDKYSPLIDSPRERRLVGDKERSVANSTLVLLSTTGLFSLILRIYLVVLNSFLQCVVKMHTR